VLLSRTDEIDGLLPVYADIRYYFRAKISMPPFFDADACLPLPATLSRMRDAAKSYDDAPLRRYAARHHYATLMLPLR